MAAAGTDPFAAHDRIQQLSGSGIYREGRLCRFYCQHSAVFFGLKFHRAVIAIPDRLRRRVREALLRAVLDADDALEQDAYTRISRKNYIFRTRRGHRYGL